MAMNRQLFEEDSSRNIKQPLHRCVQSMFGTKVTWSVEATITELEMVDQQSVVEKRTRLKRCLSQTQNVCYGMLGPLLESIIQLFGTFYAKH